LEGIRICNKRSQSACLLMLLGAWCHAHAEQRLPTIQPEQYSTEQRQAAAEFEAARHSPVFGPFEPMMHSPQAMSLARAMGDYFRYKSAVGNTLSELAILMTARAWNQDFEWAIHYPIAVKAGIKPSICDAVAQGRRPSEMSADEESVYRYVTELLMTKQVSDATFERVRARFGAKGAVDLTGLVGYYAFLAMQLNTAQYPAPKDAPRLPTIAP
jgi:4-carboxymuconolactone decarboxylase